MVLLSSLGLCFHICNKGNNNNMGVWKPHLSPLLHFLLAPDPHLFPQTCFTLSDSHFAHTILSIWNVLPILITSLIPISSCQSLLTPIKNGKTPPLCIPKVS